MDNKETAIKKLGEFKQLPIFGNMEIPLRKQEVKLTNEPHRFGNLSLKLEL